MFFCAKLLFYCTQLLFAQLSNKAYDDDDDGTGYIENSCVRSIIDFLGDRL